MGNASVVGSRRLWGSEMKLNMRMRMSGIACAAALLLAGRAGAAPLPQAAAAGGAKFEVSFLAAAHAGAITGRVFVVISSTDKPEPRLVAGSPADGGVLFGVDVNALAAGQSAVIDGSTFGAPVHSLRDIPAGDYFVQAMVNVY